MRHILQVLDLGGATRVTFGPVPNLLRKAADLKSHPKGNILKEVNFGSFLSLFTLKFEVITRKVKAGLSCLIQLDTDLLAIDHFKMRSCFIILFELINEVSTFLHLRYKNSRRSLFLFLKVNTDPRIIGRSIHHIKSVNDMPRFSIRRNRIIYNLTKKCVSKAKQIERHLILHRLTS